ncbi:hypothetical protein CLOM_g19141 [Closterium sp. NIES-68]|nr:hypothetical protein CLOM_g19141 [Closterium sp. NIES-68]GJP65587.1 hypothetical protein CLOP_g22461 [Closterium sp. NIES-67]
MHCPPYVVHYATGTLHPHPYLSRYLLASGSIQAPHRGQQTSLWNQAAYKHLTGGSRLASCIRQHTSTSQGAAD